jgi:hypothetical protein
MQAGANGSARRALLRRRSRRQRHTVCVHGALPARARPRVLRCCVADSPPAARATPDGTARPPRARTRLARHHAPARQLAALRRQLHSLRRRHGEQRASRVGRGQASRQLRASRIGRAGGRNASASRQRAAGTRGVRVPSSPGPRRTAPCSSRSRRPAPPPARAAPPWLLEPRQTPCATPGAEKACSATPRAAARASPAAARRRRRCALAAAARRREGRLRCWLVKLSQGLTFRTTLRAQSSSPRKGRLAGGRGEWRSKKSSLHQLAVRRRYRRLLPRTVGRRPDPSCAGAWRSARCARHARGEGSAARGAAVRAAAPRCLTRARRAQLRGCAAAPHSI